MEEEKGSSLNMPENIAALLGYVAGWLSGLVVLLLEKKSGFVRFHALQSVIVFGALSIAGLILPRIPFIGWLFGLLIGLGSFGAWIVGMLMAYRGERFRFPFAADIADNQLRRL